MAHQPNLKETLWVLSRSTKDREPYERNGDTDLEEVREELLRVLALETNRVLVLPDDVVLTQYDYTPAQ